MSKLPFDALTPEEDSAREIRKFIEAHRLNDKTFETLPVEVQLKRISESLKGDCETCLQNFITRDPRMDEAKDEIRELAKEDDIVLITGPTGTGKGILARALHDVREGPFISINCAAVPDTLLESEFYGHVTGAFTDAKHTNLGIFREAANGTVFLDEIGKLSLVGQAKLLSVLEDREVRPVGSARKYPISCRFVTATNRNLREMVELDKFLPDLFARLYVFEVHTTGLMERLSDIPLILEHLDGYQIQDISELPEWVMKDVAKYNVRALQAFLRRRRVLGKAA